MFDLALLAQHSPAVLAALLGGYLLGSVPFGLLLAKAAGLGDIRKIGSGNIGATNVLRTGNKTLAAATLLLDSGKGAVAVLVAKAAFGWSDPVAWQLAALAGAAAMLGHCFPVWLRFNGGKGVATALGTLLAFAWPVGVIACLLWLATAFAFRFSSLAALVAICTAPFTAWALGIPLAPELAAFIAALVLIRHRANIQRLLAGTESRIGQKSKPAPSEGS